jgi:hypothetical protein
VAAVEDVVKEKDGALAAHPSLLHRVLRPHQIAEHPIRQRKQRGAVCFEGLGLVDHRALPGPVFSPSRP